MTVSPHIAQAAASTRSEAEVRLKWQRDDLLHALDLMLALYGRPSMPDWPCDAAYDDAVSVHEIARAAIANARGSP